MYNVLHNSDKEEPIFESDQRAVFTAAAFIMKDCFEDYLGKVKKCPWQPLGLIICSSKKYVGLKTKNTFYRKECHKDDEFDWKIGLGLAISQFASDEHWKKKINVNINNYRNTVIEKENGKVINTYKELDYVAYATIVLKRFLNIIGVDYKDFTNRVDEALKVKKDFYVSFQNYKNDLKKITKKEEK